MILMRWMRIGLAAMVGMVLACSVAAGARPAAAVVYTQPASPTGGLLLSSVRDPDGSANDQWIWEAFTLPAATDVLEIRWTGGYDPTRRGMGGAIKMFTVSIYASNAPKTQPDLSGLPLVRYETPDNCGEAAGAVLGGVQMYTYAFTLPQAFHAQSGVKYWVQIEGYQPGSLPDWGLTKATGGDGFYFRKVAGETQYQTLTGDTAFSLLADQAAVHKVYLPVIIHGVTP